MYEVPESTLRARRASSPSTFNTLAELPRVVLEASALLQTWPLLYRGSRGDGHPVLVLPGFLTSDLSTTMLRQYLSDRGYRALPWRLGTNTGSADLVVRLMRQFQRLAHAYDEPVTLIGQSLGGVFARELARRFPDRVRQVISLGSPFGAMSDGSTNAVVARLFRIVSGDTPASLRAKVGQIDTVEPPPGVPCTAIYSRTDGVVHWRSCVERKTALTQNIEIIGSHSGMAFHPAVYAIINDRLRLPPGAWQPYDPTRGWRRWFVSDGAAAPAN